MAATKATKATFVKAKKQAPAHLVASQAPHTTHDLVHDFFGYRNKEEITILPEGYLITGSQNVVCTPTGMVSVRNGYTLDGQSDSTVAGTNASFDWISHTGNERNLRAANGKLQFRYVATAGDSWNGNTFTASQVYWITLLSGLTAAQEKFNFAVFWNTTALQQYLLMVNGQSQIQEWSGGVTTIASVTSNTITKTGTNTWTQEGFYTTGNIDINGTTYAYTGGAGTTTLTGVTPDPTIQNPSANSVTFQTVKTTLNSAMTSISSTLANDLIGIVKNQVYIGSFKNNSVYVSKTSDYTSYAFSATRAVGEGALLTLDSTPIAFVPQEDVMYISAGKDWWYNVKFQLSADLTTESLTIAPLKTSPLQAAISQSAITKAKNSVMFISNEPSLDDLGRIADNLATPQSVNMSDPIKNDFFSYDFTGATCLYHKLFLYVAVPAEQLVLIYNFAQEWWEAPQILPISRFAIIGGVLYGHSSQSPETYKLFDGTSDNGNPIHAIAAFSYQNFGNRSGLKNFTEMYVEGYIAPNTDLAVGVKYDFGGINGIQQFNVIGSDTSVLFSTITDGSFGKNPLGSNPLGSITDSPSNLSKFRVIFTTKKVNFYEYEVFFETNDIDFQWQILSFGPNISLSLDQNVSIKK